MIYYFVKFQQGIGGDSIQDIHVSSDSDLRTEIAVLREQVYLTF